MLLCGILCRPRMPYLPGRREQYRTANTPPRTLLGCTLANQALSWPHSQTSGGGLATPPQANRLKYRTASFVANLRNKGMRRSSHTMYRYAPCMHFSGRVWDHGRTTSSPYTAASSDRRGQGGLTCYGTAIVGTAIVDTVD